MKLEHKSLYELDLVKEGPFEGWVLIRVMRRCDRQVTAVGAEPDLESALRKVSYLACEPFSDVCRINSIGLLFTKQTGRNLQEIIKGVK